nr:methylmalonyl Co-A mutase-associated GTPase MeaB [candidate division Zixibacteria bacterium]
MTEDKPNRKKRDSHPSALHVVRGVEGGHDGLPGNSRKNTERKKPSAENHGLTTAQYIEGVLAGDRTILGKAITLIESNAPAHQNQAQDVLRELLPHTGCSLRVGITGIPGAGKSTFIETLGCRLTAQDHKVAVMAVDPSSSLTRGSILGDKTRMEQLSREPGAFIRPSPSGGTLGGVARKTRETMLVFEAAGYDVILVETIGVGQSEITVRSMVDFFLLILIAGGGDELQGLKRGVMEIADAVLINKVDGDNIKPARLAQTDYQRALHYLQPATRGWQTEAHLASSLTGYGIDDIWKVILKFREITGRNGEFDRRRREQSRDWLHTMLEERLKDLFYRHPNVEKKLPEIEQKVMNGRLPVTIAAWELLQTFEKE